MAEKLKAHGADDAVALVSVRDWHPKRPINTRKQFRSQFYSHYDLGPNLMASLREGPKEVDHG